MEFFIMTCSCMAVAGFKESQIVEDVWEIVVLFSVGCLF